jgi:mono/diheme cytochrome c family protein
MTGPALLGVLLAGIVCLLPGATVSAQGMRPPPSGTLEAPFDLRDDVVVADGRRLFQQNCTGYCHGREGRLSRAPKLRGRQFESAYLYTRIANGVPPMPAYQTLLSRDDIWKLVAYIHSLADVMEDN